MTAKEKVVVILGPTATGKDSLWNSSCPKAQKGNHLR